MDSKTPGTPRTVTAPAAVIALALIGSVTMPRPLATSGKAPMSRSSKKPQKIQLPRPRVSAASRMFCTIEPGG